MPTTVPLEEFLQLAGRELGPSRWFEIDQERIDRFADVTLDDQFIHSDPERAAQTPLGSTIAHGFLTLSLIPHLSREIALVPEGVEMAFNYGLDRVRFLQPVKSGSRVRLRTKILDVKEKTPGRLLARAEATVEIEGEDRPALVARTLAMYVVG
jgi:acyl dehydratase